RRPARPVGAAAPVAEAARRLRPAPPRRLPRLPARAARRSHPRPRKGPGRGADHGVARRLVAALTLRREHRPDGQRCAVPCAVASDATAAATAAGPPVPTGRRWPSVRSIIGGILVPPFLML